MEQVQFPRILFTDYPAAEAEVSSVMGYNISGRVCFWPFKGGSLVLYSIDGLPSDDFFGFHIHTFPVSSGDPATAGGHYDSAGRQHPMHQGDMPPLLSCGGFAYGMFFTDRFTPGDVIGRSVMIHGHPDDFSSDTSGHSGPRIGFGNITANDG